MRASAEVQIIDPLHVLVKTEMPDPSIQPRQSYLLWRRW
jgi:hypothetical protein